MQFPNHSPTPQPPQEPVGQYTTLWWFNPSASIPATKTIITINVIVYLLMGVFTFGQSLINANSQMGLLFGADFGPLTFTTQSWRIITSMFVHFSFLHIAMNMVVFWDVGKLAERLFGSLKFFIVYMLAGAGASLCSLLFNPMIVSAGASGAVFGAYGGLLAFFLIHSKSFPAGYIQDRTKTIFAFLVYNLFFGFAVHGIDNAAHIGGFITGFIIGCSLIAPNKEGWRWTFTNVLLTVACITGLHYWHKLDAERFFATRNAQQQSPHD